MVYVKDLVLHLDDRGYLYEMLRVDDECFTQFGQAYISAINPGVVKGFHKHFKQTDHIVCVQGQIKLVTIDDKIDPAVVSEYSLSPLSPMMVVIEPSIWHGWMCIGNERALVVNFSTHPFNSTNPDEDRTSPHNNPWDYVWGVVDK